MHANLFNHTFTYLVTVLKKDKLKIIFWLLGISFFVVAVGHAYPALFPDQAELIGLAEAMRNPMMVAMFGPVYDPENYTIAQALGNQMLIFSMMFSAIMSIFIVSKMTRGDEEEGILELIQSLPVGRLTQTGVTVILIVFMNIILALLIGFGLALIPEDSITMVGSLTYGFSIGATGILMGAITLILAQLFENNRTVMGMSFLVLGVMYLLRGMGDLSENILVWLMPLNWPARVEVYINNYNGLNVLTLGLSFVLFAVGCYLNLRRDLEAGMFAQKPGKTAASKVLKTPTGFVLRLLKAGLIAWIVTLFVLGLTYGSIFGDLDTFIEGSDIFEQMLPGGEYPLNVQFMSVIMMVVALTAGIGPIMFLNRLATEEKKNHTEHLYARALSRTRLLSIFTVTALISSALLLFIGSLGLIMGVQVSMDEPIGSLQILQAGFAYLPALWFMIGLGVLLIGFLPQKTSIIWIYFVYAFFAVYLGNVINLPAFFSYLTPYGFIDQLPIDAFRILPTVIILTLTAIMVVLGYVGYIKRDLKG